MAVRESVKEIQTAVQDISAETISALRSPTLANLGPADLTQTAGQTTRAVMSVVALLAMSQCLVESKAVRESVKEIQTAIWDTGVATISAW